MKLHITCRIMIPVDSRIIDRKEKQPFPTVLPETNRFVSPKTKGTNNEKQILFDYVS